MDSDGRSSCSRSRWRSISSSGDATNLILVALPVGLNCGRPMTGFRFAVDVDMSPFDSDDARSWQEGTRPGESTWGKGGLKMGWGEGGGMGGQ